MVKLKEYYPLADRLTPEEKNRFGIPIGQITPHATLWNMKANNVRDGDFIVARWTGRKRIPQKGEWYLSGSEIAAYRAPHNLLTPYCIAELVKVVKKTKIVIEEVG